MNKMPPIISHHEAKNLGLKRFFTGKPCKYGHISERLTSNRSCLVCGKIKLQRWQQENPQKVRALDNARHLRDKDKRNAAARARAKRDGAAATKRKNEWAANNRDKVKKIQKRWNDKNRHKINAYAANRRALLFGAGQHTGEDIKQLYQSQDGNCGICEKRLGRWHVDHIVPISKGGLNTKDNLQLLCKTCNLRKGAKSLEEVLSFLKVNNGTQGGITK
jgi:5-methylcytosine-specific restriction endonuclease McrA